MKLKNTLMVTFLTLTIIPIVIVTILLYQSGFILSKESYTRNLVESITVQSDYISQTIENNMVSDNRFATQNITSEKLNKDVKVDGESDLHTAITSYLGNAEDKITVCIVLDNTNKSIYSIGEKKMIDSIGTQLPKPAELTNQKVIEFNLGNGSRSLGVVTPIWEQNTYVGSLISVYDESYIFKIISSYYEMADTSTYVCGPDGDIVSSRQLSDDNSENIEKNLKGLTLSAEGKFNANTSSTSLSGYYKNIHNTPWYLIGLVDDALINSFANQFLPIYIFIILGVLLVDIILSFYFSRRVVKPINNLIKVMEGYQNSLNGQELQYKEEEGYVETKYLRTKFLELMKNILLVQHNFEGIYNLYQSNNTGDINVDIDVKNQTISSNKDLFENLINTIEVPKDACIVEKFTHCFCSKDQHMLMEMFVSMRDEHLSVTQEAEVHTPYMDGKWFHTLVVPMYTNERLSRLFVQLRDISSFKRQEMESSEHAKRDELTGLYNRAGFASCVEEALETGTKTDLHALLFIDMDYFKLVNDNFGHAAGDELLQTIGKSLLETAGENDVVCRFGGDEFAVFLAKTSPEHIKNMEHTIKEKLVYNYSIDKGSFSVSASIGVSTCYNDSPGALKALLDNADAAMYKAKREFKQSMEI